MSASSLTLMDIEEAAERIEPYVVRTPCLPCEALSRELGCQLWFKAENLQAIGAFKARGASNAVMALSDEAASRGVVTHSSGNHAAALARAAVLRGVPAHVVMPHDSAKFKIDAVREFGVEPVFCEPDAESRAAAADFVQQTTGAIMVHPYDDFRVMAGQGTVGLEILAQVPRVDAVVVPVGGGGLLAGVLMAIKSLRPSVRVVAAEPAWADDTSRSLQSGQREAPLRYDSVADGLRTPVGLYTFPIIERLLDELLLASEESILKATRTIATRARMVAEPSGGVTLAAVASWAERFAGKTVVVVISGGNCDLG